jgi:hypothetical protein
MLVGLCVHTLVDLPEGALSQQVTVPVFETIKLVLFTLIHW